MEIIVGILIRHALTALGALLVAKGYADGETAQAVIGSGTTLFGFALSVFNKKRTGVL